MFRNLKSEMVRRNVTTRAISKEIGRTEKSVQMKLSGKTQFTIGEALRIRDAFFPGMDLEFLFSQDKVS